MKTISIFNNKGGVGKTTTTLCIGYELAQNHNKRVLLIDNDGQGNLSTVAKSKSEYTLSNALKGGWVPKEAIAKTAYENLDIIISDKALEDVVFNGMKNEPENWDYMRDILESLQDQYDYCLIDNGPARGCQLFNSLCASDELIVPILLDAYSLRGLNEINNLINRARQVQPDLLLLGVLINNYEKDQTITEIEKQLMAQERYPVFRTHIRRSKKMLSGSFSQKAIQEYSKSCGTSKDFAKIVSDYLDGNI